LVLLPKVNGLWKILIDANGKQVVTAEIFEQGLTMADTKSFGN
jgi:hypothetical protein